MIIDSHIPEIIEKLKSTNRLVLVSTPGSGKTTRLPPALMKSGLFSNSKILLLQPRRIAAQMTSQRMAEENKIQLGEEIGYQIRFDNRQSEKTKLLVMTEAILTRRFVSDADLDGVGCVILDEFHERSIHTDLALTLLLELQESLRPDLKIIVMSATLESKTVSKFLRDCEVYQVDAHLHPIEYHYSQRSVPLNLGDDLYHLILEKTQETLRSEYKGDILIFLPGAREIERALIEVKSKLGEKYMYLPFHGRLDAELQSQIFRDSVQRKIIFATNIAETSITIPGVTTVIDSGLARNMIYDPASRVETLETQRISKASADQRAGRAARTGPGQCFRLWTKLDHIALQQFDLPDVKKIEMTDTLLSLSHWGYPDPKKFNWFEPPHAENLAQGQNLLKDLGLITKDGLLTEAGRKVVDIPLHPRESILLQAAHEVGAFDEVCELVAAMGLLTQRDQPIHNHLESDILDLHTSLPYHLKNQFKKSVDQFQFLFKKRSRQKVVTSELQKNYLESIKNKDELKMALLLFSHSDRLCRRRTKGEGNAQMVGSQGVTLSKNSSVRNSELFLAISLKGFSTSTRDQVTVHLASRIEKVWVEKLLPSLVANKDESFWDKKEKKTISQRSTYFRDIAIEEPRPLPITKEAKSNALFNYVSKNLQEFAESNETLKNLILRLEYLGQKDLSAGGEIFLNTLKTICDQIPEFESLKNADIEQALFENLDYSLKKEIEQKVPGQMTLPNGRRAPIRYAKGQPPILSAKLQDLFGWKETPKIGSPAQPITLEILGPNMRPIQVTSDLARFWKGSYFEIRKELRARYPRQAWPENPEETPPIERKKK